MNSNIKIIDYDTWDRNYIFDAYKGTDFPYINIGCDLDITNLYQYVKEEDLSLYFSMIYAATKIANEVKNFGYRFEEKDGRIIMPFSSQTHHGLTDGYHVGMFFNRLQEYLEDCGWK